MQSSVQISEEVQSLIYHVRASERGKLLEALFGKTEVAHIAVFNSLAAHTEGLWLQRIPWA